MSYSAADDISDRADWDPQLGNLSGDPRTVYDAMRERCPVAHSEGKTSWTVFRHADALRVLEDPATFSNTVSTHVSVPNGMDPPEHGHYRALIEPLLAPERVAAFASECQRIVAESLQNLRESGRTDWMRTHAAPLAAALQCAYLGWPTDLQAALIDWSRRSQEATRAGRRDQLAAVHASFEAIVDEAIDCASHAADATPTVTTELCNATVHGRPLRRKEIASVLRNWTAGELATMAAASGILLHFLASRPELADELRRKPSLIPTAVDEILRLHGPLLGNRRVATRDITLGERRIAAGEQLQINWVAVNRDPAAFSQADRFQPDRDSGNYLLYGAGIHVCPGAALARLELRSFLTQALTHGPVSLEGQPRFARPPASGFSSLPLRLLPRG